MSVERLNAVFSGRVQGVGFRYTVDAHARFLHLKGWVRNNGNRTVELLAEGEREKLEDLLGRVQKEMGYYISDTKISYGPATGQFSRFEIKFT